MFPGWAYGASGGSLGEVVFCTGMTGYQETLTDPSYYGQIVVQTAPQIGNTGWNDEDDESARIWVSGYVVRDPARTPSSWRTTRTLEEELARQGIVGVAGIDTRGLVDDPLDGDEHPITGRGTTAEHRGHVRAQKGRRNGDRHNERDELRPCGKGHPSRSGNSSAIAR